LRRFYFFLVNPFGHTGLTAVTFLVVLPFTQVIVVVLALAAVTTWLLAAVWDVPVAAGPELFWFASVAALLPV
jgi:hypothetical protein